MYFLELLAKAFIGEKKPQTGYNPLDDETSNVLDEDAENCEHLFLPLDSSNDYFACKYCGLVVPKEKLKNKNIFENKSF